MAKASFKLPNGTTVELDGSPEEIQKLLLLYGGQQSAPAADTPPVRPKRKRPARKSSKGSPTSAATPKPTIDLAAIVRTLKEWDQFEAVEKRILDKASQVDRTLLPLFVISELMPNSRVALTSGDISKITAELGVPLSVANVSSTLASTAQRYVHGDTVRKRGQPVRYQLTRRGVQYMKSVIAGNSHEDEK